METSVCLPHLGAKYVAVAQVQAQSAKMDVAFPDSGIWAQAFLDKDLHIFSNDLAKRIPEVSAVKTDRKDSVSDLNLTFKGDALLETIPVKYK